MKFVFSPDYSVDIGAHVFPTQKFALVRDRLVERGLAKAKEFLDPGEASRADLLLVHSPQWVGKILEGRTNLDDEMLMELPWSKALAKAHSKAAAGTLLAARHALESGLGVHVGGGSHHAFAGHGEGFCVFNDLAVAIRVLQREDPSARAAVIDLDVHQGNGTASIFAGDPSVATFSMHQEDNYPVVKPPGTVDIGLPGGTSDEKYLKLLSERLGPFLDDARPKLALYQAGVDCWEGDALGGLKLSRAGLAARDEAVFSACFKRKAPVVITLGGGYAARIEDTVALHAQTIAIGLEKHRRDRSG
ncbi:MAG: histone deacetylase [Elusimicrobiota bacterium]